MVYFYSFIVFIKVYMLCSLEKLINQYLQKIFLIVTVRDNYY